MNPKMTRGIPPVRSAKNCFHFFFKTNRTAITKMSKMDSKRAIMTNGGNQNNFFGRALSFPERISAEAMISMKLSVA